jgi:DNA sulfur modification protein DndC
VNDLARKQGRPLVDHLNDEEANRIRELITAKTWPDGWRGDEPTGDESYTQWFVDGSKQETLFSVSDEE